ncbi:MAG: Nucleoside-diphosphate-sugar epimerase-like protein [Frankiales bacterium]|nr:Nucleoside-diphosphate-sugar epimerase-like protein [Frankiales bacterium]
MIAVTGAGSGLGRALVERLAAREDFGGLLGIDTVPARIDGVVWHAMDVRDSQLAHRLAGATTVVHLATSYDVTLPAATRRGLNVQGTQHVLVAAREAGVKRVVLCTSTEVYGARPDNPVPLKDAAKLLGEPDEGTLAHDHATIEQLAADASRRGFEVSVLRPATLVGLSAAYDGQVLRQLSSPRLLAVRGTEPLWQLCHVDDLLTAIELCAFGAVKGALAVGAEGGMKQSVVEELAGKRRLEVPASVAFSTAERLRRAGVTDSSPRELDHLLGPLVVASDGLRAAGWRPRWTNEDALMAHLAARADSRVPVYTAAGATVALLGTAALVRQARRRRRGL